MEQLGWMNINHCNNKNCQDLLCRFFERIRFEPKRDKYIDENDVTEE